MFEFSLSQLNFLSLAVSIISMIACYFNIKQDKVCFIIWSFTNMGFIIVNILSKMYGQIPLWIVFTALNVYGYLEWSKKEKIL